MKRSYSVVGGSALALLALLVYWPALGGDWLWDDRALIVDNVHLRSAAGLWALWTGAPLGDYWPLTWTLFWIEWHLWGASPLGYHVVSFLLHVLSALLLWRVLARLGLRWAWLGALLFLVHPLAVESVAWISETKNTLSLPLCLGSFLLWLDVRGSRRRGPWLASILLFLAAMLAKSSVVMLPFVLLLHAWWADGRITRRLALRTSPYFLVALLLGLVTIWFQSGRSAGLANAPENPVTFVVALGATIFFYLGKFLWPVPLIPIYPLWNAASSSALAYLAIPALAAVFFLLWRVRQGWGRPVLFGLGVFLLNLLPVLGLVPTAYMSISPVADHFVYLPMTALATLVALALETLLFTVPRPLKMLPFIAVGLLILLSIWTARDYAKIFTSREAMWTYTLDRNPDATPALNDMGLIYLQRDDFDRARTVMERGLQLAPGNAEMHRNFAVLNMMQGRIEEAVEQYNLALQCEPGELQAIMGRGTASLALNDLVAARSDFKTYLAQKPDPPESATILVWIWLIESKLRHVEEADRDLAAELRTNPAFTAMPQAASEARFLLARTEPDRIPASPADACATWYYIGEARLLEGNKPGSIDALRRSMQTGEIRTIEYTLARAELERLGALSSQR